MTLYAKEGTFFGARVCDHLLFSWTPQASIAPLLLTHQEGEPLEKVITPARQYKISFFTGMGHESPSVTPLHFKLIFLLSIMSGLCPIKRTLA